MAATSRAGELAARLAAAGFGIATLGALAIGAFGSAAWREGLGEGGPGCPFLAATGVHCPFCGMTRGTIALGHGDLHAALGFHPLAPVVLVVVLALCTIVAFGRARWLAASRARVAGVVGVVAAIWIARLVLER